MSGEPNAAAGCPFRPGQTLRVVSLPERMAPKAKVPFAIGDTVTCQRVTVSGRSIVLAGKDGAWRIERFVPA